MRQVERVVAEHPDIGLLTADQVLDYLLAAIAPLVGALTCRARHETAR